MPQRDAERGIAFRVFAIDYAEPRNDELGFLFAEEAQRQPDQAADERERNEH